MAEKYNLENFNAIDMTAKKVLVALSEFANGELVKGELIQKKTNLSPNEINKAIRSLSKSLLVNIPDPLINLAPFDFYAIEITDFGRQVLAQFG